MASFFVVTTFDLKDASSADYDCAEKNLNAVGLSKTLKSGTVNLPYNTFAGQFTGKDAPSVRDFVRTKAKAALNKCGLSGNLFVSVGGDWTWGSTTF
ncbi:hypothetical protein Enr10x_52380 [Gimesia panareensis]|uniref:Uncharacterized protein n=1 Tax=Gimesia panareensis TaxID=2527978 RepID=A0A517QE24_9PLAN|nr:hypothetical protein [Gimesia panareensis]QDT29881.1 hypothetical protein Enr10x_52380 [Gimesia panareensis]